MKIRVGCAMFVAFLGLLSNATPLFAARERLLYNFCSAPGCLDGNTPQGGLVFDRNGNLYGTTKSGGTYNSGVAFQLTPGKDGKWSERVLYNFCTALACRDGNEPIAALVVDSLGNLYGVTYEGGDGGCYLGCGTVFELSPDKNGRWTEKVIHSFNNNGKDGFTPVGGLALDASGTLYGTTYSGGTHPNCRGEGCGAGFQLKPDANGKWTERLIHNFDDNGDGYYPEAALTLDASGNVYGTTVSGGPEGWGTVFELSPGANGEWAETILHSFRLTDGGAPSTSVVFDSAGNLYGTADDGGDLNCETYGCGTVFELTPSGNGKWKEKVLHSFQSYISVSNGLALDGSGNIFATTAAAGLYACGFAYELAPSVKGKGRWKTIHNFGGSGDGCDVSGSLIFDGNGNLYGATTFGGNPGDGTIFEIEP